VKRTIEQRLMELERRVGVLEGTRTRRCSKCAGVGYTRDGVHDIFPCTCNPSHPNYGRFRKRK
jgi:hypothetical protein